MEFIADLHIHSHYSRATSKLLIPEYLDYYAGIKGIKVVGTGDFTHPGWLKELKTKFEPEGNGLFRLKKTSRIKPFAAENETRFLLTAEISTIYKAEGKVRKVHNIVFTPGFEEAEKINLKLINSGGNLSSDGRPILGMDSKKLLEIILDCDEKNFFIPAHIWTPWFSMLGSKSGFDSPEECFGDLTRYIFALETGLSTDAPMNWLCSFLDRFVLISNSDAHSPDRLGRNANIFVSELSYSGITDALKTGRPDYFAGTIDLFPQEGKYHFDGHRNCGICLNPVETFRNNGVCPKCRKPLTIGVMNRIVQLADRDHPEARPNRLPYHSIIPLKEIIAEIQQTGVDSNVVDQFYQQTLKKLGPELKILLEIPLDEIHSKSGEILFEAIRRMRSREVIIEEGYDGEYGKIKVFRDGEIKNFGSGSLFGISDIFQDAPKKTNLINFDINEIRKLIQEQTGNENLGVAAEPTAGYNSEIRTKLSDPDQRAVIEHTTGSALIIAGPGTGKTKTLTEKIAWLIEKGIAGPSQILAITFTNKAAAEMKQRLSILLVNPDMVTTLTIQTFHSFGMAILKENAGFFGRTESFSIIDEPIREKIIKSIGEPGQKIPGQVISEIKNQSDHINVESVFFNKYETRLRELNAFDFDDLISKPVVLFYEHPEVLEKLQKKFNFIFVDEFQDTNPKQYELVRAIMPESASKLCVVGDPNQSIYGFRGASGSIMHQFLIDYPEAGVFKLKTSYRCPQSVLDASAMVLDKNENPLTGLISGLKINISEQATEKSEAEFIAREIVKQMGGISFFSIDSAVTDGYSENSGNGISGIGVLCRTKHQFPAIIKAFNDHLIPYQVAGEEPFYSEEPFKSLILLLTAVSLTGSGSLLPFLKLNNLKYFTEELENFSNSVTGSKISDIIYTAAVRFFSLSHFDEIDFQRFRYLSEGFTDLKDFLNNISLGTGADTIHDSTDKVLLMTIHASKGLEFDCVFIPGCEQGLLPYTLYKKETNITEERRLFYVGMTRVKRILYLSHAKQRMLRNRKLVLPKSSFLLSIEDELLNKIGSYKPEKPGNTDEQLKLF